jgi:hypothetical protein
MSVSRAEVNSATEDVLAVLDARKPSERLALIDDPCGVIGSWADVELRFVPAVETDSRCSVAGAYIWDSEPPLLAVAQAASAGRRAFTALHELAHHLQQTDVGLAEKLAVAGDRGRVLEEAVCDSFAAAVLLPDALVDQHIPTAGPTVYDVAALHAASSASRAAVCVRAAQRLRSPGHVVLLDYDGTVQFAAGHGLPPVAKGSNQGSAPVVQEAIGSLRTAKGRTRLRYRDDIRGEELFAQAGDVDGYVVVVATADRPPWEDDFVLPSREVTPTARSWVCEQPGCDNVFTSFDPACAKCGMPKCPECGRCRCAPAVAERVCKNCFTSYSVHFFDGDSKVCRNCA